LGRKLIEQAMREMEQAKVAGKSAKEGLKHAHSILTAQGIRYDKKLVDSRLPKQAKKYGVAEDVGKVMWYIKEQVKFKPKDLNHFWGYTTRVMQFPPFEPVAHMRKRRGKKPLPSREWRFLMQVKRYPHTIKEYPPDWLGVSLISNPSFARVHELYVAEAREILSGEIDGDSFVDTATPTFVNSGKTITDTDLGSFLERLERM